MRFRQFVLPLRVAGVSILAVLIAPGGERLFAAPRPAPQAAASAPGQTAPQAAKKDASAPPAEKTAGEAFKNVQMFKDLPASQFMPNMFFFTQALGVGCDHCHVTSDSGPWPMEKDDKKQKQTAREMIKMMRSINDSFFSGQVQVTCATCHQGHPEPSNIPPLRALGAKPEEEERLTLAQLPKADDLLDHYLQAIGGAAALEKLTTRKIKGVLVTESGKTSTLDITQKAPNLGLAATVSPNSQITREGFDGSVAWNSFDDHAFESHGLEGARIARDAQFFVETQAKKLYPRRFTAGRETVGDEDAYVVRAGGPGAVSEKLWFSVKSGLLLRRQVMTRTTSGRYLEETDYSDYRDVDGVKLPFTVTRLEVNARYTEKYSEIKHNVPVDDAIFRTPVSPAEK